MEILVASALGFMTAAGVYLTLRKRTFAVVLGMTLLSYTTNVFLFISGRLSVNLPPVLQKGVTDYSDPLPQALVLTAIVISFGMTAVVVMMALGAFLEGVAGFGVPIAICAALLVQLGFAPLRAAVLSLVANVGAGAYGAIGIPVLVGAQVTGLEVMELSRAMVLLLQPLTVLVPFLLVILMDGLRGLSSFRNNRFSDSNHRG